MQSKIKKIIPMMVKRKEAIPKYSRNPNSNGGGAIGVVLAFKEYLLMDVWFIR